MRYTGASRSQCPERCLPRTRMRVGAVWTRFKQSICYTKVQPPRLPHRHQCQAPDSATVTFMKFGDGCFVLSHIWCKLRTHLICAELAVSCIVIWFYYMSMKQACIRGVLAAHATVCNFHVTPCANSTFLGSPWRSMRCAFVHTCSLCRACDAAACASALIKVQQCKQVDSL